MQDPPLNIVVLDGHTANPGDLSWRPLERWGKVRVYPRTAAGEVIPRSEGAQILVVNKVRIGKEELRKLPHLRLLAVTATGLNNIDLEAARAAGVGVCHVPGYGAPSVAQHVFALVLALNNAPARHHADVVQGGWSRNPDWCYTVKPVFELQGKILGLFGLGEIAQAVARIGQAFGMEVIAHRKNQGKGAPTGVRLVELETLFRQSDVLSLHAPLTPETHHLVNARTLSWMKPSALLINTARGGLVDEAALLQALTEGRLAGAGLDVLSVEPPPPDHPLFRAPNCLITPHMAWATREARQRLLDITFQNIEAFLGGESRNRVV